MNLLDYIPSVPDFPKPGILFKDISPLLANPQAFANAVHGLQRLSEFQDFDYILGIESRGFIFGTSLAQACNRGLILARKPKKLPSDVFSEPYGLEYGTDALEIQQKILPENSKVLLVDDVLATGGTLIAAANLVKRSKAIPVGAVVLLEIIDLGGKEKLASVNLPCKSLIEI
jgi:adenine phosphoribosyltransferase